MHYQDVIATIYVLILLSIHRRASGWKSYQFADMTFEEMNSEIRLLPGQGSYLSVTTAKELFNIEQSKYNGYECTPNIIRITHLASLQSDNQRPQIFISGEIHGDERVGPLAALATAKILVWAAMCEIEKSSEHCDMIEAIYSISSIQRKWLAFLATRRDTFIVPTTNCLGYKFHQRNDANVDPNRDFPYSRSNNNCLQSLTARIINSLMRDTLIQIVVTFHGGMVALGYEWGSRNHPKPHDNSPDDIVNTELAIGMREYAGGFQGEEKYPIGRINSLVYPVDGGMEDWIYAAGWDKQSNKLCNNLKEKVAENNRAIVFLVEASDRKKPDSSTLGQSANILEPHSLAPVNGHASRNTRLSIVPIEMLQPYNCIRRIHKYTEIDSDKSSEYLFNLRGLDEMSISWTVGGANTVDYTFLAWHQSPRLPTKLNPADWTQYLNTLEPPLPFTALKPQQRRNKRRNLIWRQSMHNTFRRWNNRFDELRDTPISISTRVLQRNGANNTAYLASKIFVSNNIHSVNNFSYGINSNSRDFQSNVSSIAFDPFGGKQRQLAPGEYWLVAWSIVDLQWGERNQGSPDGMPQSYIANARTNPNWNIKSEASNLNSPRIVQGRIMWPSDPTVVTITSQGRMEVTAATLHCSWWNKLSKSNNNDEASAIGEIIGDSSQQPRENSKSFIIGTETKGETLVDLVSEADFSVQSNEYRNFWTFLVVSVVVIGCYLYFKCKRI